MGHEDRNTLTAGPALEEQQVFFENVRESQIQYMERDGILSKVRDAYIAKLAQTEIPGKLNPHVPADILKTGDPDRYGVYKDLAEAANFGVCSEEGDTHTDLYVTDGSQDWEGKIFIGRRLIRQDGKVTYKVNEKMSFTKNDAETVFVLAEELKEFKESGKLPDISDDLRSIGKEVPVSQQSRAKEEADPGLRILSPGEVATINLDAEISKGVSPEIFISPSGNIKLNAISTGVIIRIGNEEDSDIEPIPFIDLEILDIRNNPPVKKYGYERHIPSVEGSKSFSLKGDFVVAVKDMNGSVLTLIETRDDLVMPVGTNTDFAAFRHLKDHGELPESMAPKHLTLKIEANVLTLQNHNHRGRTSLVDGKETKDVHNSELQEMQRESEELQAALEADARDKVYGAFTDEELENAHDEDEPFTLEEEMALQARERAAKTTAQPSKSAFRKIIDKIRKPFVLRKKQK